MNNQDNESKLSRWSRRKQQTLEQTQQEDLELDLLTTADSDQLPEPTINEESDSIQAESDQPVLTDSDMPPIETLNSESDFSMFMSSGVTDKLRNLALKQLFKAPLFNIRDGLDEYDEDYTFFEKLGDTVTCDMKHQMEMEALKKEAAEAVKEEEINETSKNEDNAKDPVEDEELIVDLDDDFGDDIEPIEFNQQGLEQISTKPEILKGSVISKGESS